MDERVEIPDLRMSTKELLAFQRDLKQEKEMLLKLLTKIDNQVHSLQVEQLHLLSVMNKSLKDDDKHSTDESEDDMRMETGSNKSLDLSLVPDFRNLEEKDDDDEEEDDDEDL